MAGRTEELEVDPWAGERRFRALVEAGADGLVLVGPDARILYANRAVEEIFGRSRAEVLDRGGFEWVFPADRELAAVELDLLVRTPGGRRMATLRYLAPDGSARWVEATGRNLLDDPDVQALAISLRDVTDRMGAEAELRLAAAVVESSKEALEASEERYKNLFDQNPLPMWVYEPETLRFLAVNEAAVRDYGYSHEEFLQMTLVDIRPEEDVPDFLQAMQVDRSDDVWRHRKRDGTVFDVEIHSHAVTTGDRPARLVIARDVTTRRRAERELRKALEAERAAAQRLRTLDEMKNTFLNAVSHELRTPLSAVLGSALTLERIGTELTDDERREMIRAVAANARKLERMLGDLLDLDRLTRGVVQARLAANELGSLIRGVVESTEFKDLRPIEVETHPMVLRVDGPKVQRIVENLLANAVKYTPEGSPIWIRVRRVPEGAEIVVEDVGPGVPYDARDAIFEPFRQGANRSEHAPGVGIGLSLVARFAEMHGGRAWVEDRPGGGACFRVLLREPTAPRPERD